MSGSPDMATITTAVTNNLEIVAKKEGNIFPALHNTIVNFTYNMYMLIIRRNVLHVVAFLFSSADTRVCHVI